MREKVPVAIALTTLNEERTISDFLRSLSAQTVLPAEIVVCDGGSTDQTCEIAAAWNAEAPPLKLIRAPGASIAQGRNAAIRHTVSELIAVSDAGCVLHPEWLARISEPLLSDPSVDVVSGGYRIGWISPFQKMVAASEIPIDHIPADVFLPSSRSFAIRRSAWEAVGGYPEHLTFAGEDTVLCLRLRAAGKRFAQKLDAIVTWHPRNSLPAYIRQHYHYGVGDGEGRVKSWFYAKIVLKNLIAGCAAAAAFLHPAAIAALPLLATAYYFHLRPIYRWGLVSPSASVGAFTLIAVKEWSLFAGWTVGMIHAVTRRSG